MAKAKGNRARPAAKHPVGRPPVSGARMATSINVRVPVELRAAAEVKASAGGLEITQVVRELIKGYVAGEFEVSLTRRAGEQDIPFE